MEKTMARWAGETEKNNTVDILIHLGVLWILIGAIPAAVLSHYTVWYWGVVLYFGILAIFCWIVFRIPISEWGGDIEEPAREEYKVWAICENCNKGGDFILSKGSNLIDVKCPICLVKGLEGLKD